MGMLSGKVLLKKVKSIADRPLDEIVRTCGYVAPSGRLMRQQFYEALVVAKGFALPNVTRKNHTVPGQSGRGRQADFCARVHGNGNIIVGSTYTRRMGLVPGQEFVIQVDPETGSIWLMPKDGQEFEIH